MINSIYSTVYAVYKYKGHWLFARTRRVFWVNWVSLSVKILSEYLHEL